MIKTLIKDTLDDFAKEYGLQEICYYERLYTLLSVVISDMNEQNFIITLNTDINHFDDLKLLQLSDKELNLIIDVDDEANDFISYHLVIDKVGNRLRVKDIEKIENGILFETLKNSEFDKLIKS